MTTKWREMRLGDFVSLQRGHDLPEQDRRPGRVPIIGSFGLTGYHDTVKTKGPGVTVGRSGASFGVISFCAEDYWPLNTALYVTDFHGNDPRFAYYFLKTIDFSGFNSGSAQPSLNRNFIHPIPVCVPSPGEQRRIAEILAAYDDKIELNRRMNETLEATARALFNSWFVNYDPVHAKTVARRQHPTWSNAQVSRAALPNLAPDIAELFPDHFEESTLGPIPAGWRVGTVGDIGDNPRRSVQPSEITHSTSYIALEHMPRRCIALSDWGNADEVASGKFRFCSGEILFGKLRPYFHKVGVPAIDGVCSTDVLVIVPRVEHWFGPLLGHVSSDAMIAHTDTSSTGTKMPRTNWSDIARFEIAIPPEPIATAATHYIRAIISRIHANIHDSRSLALARDALLPRLLSGVLKVNANSIRSQP